VVIKEHGARGDGRTAGYAGRAVHGAPLFGRQHPEFLKEGAAVNDFVRPDRVVIGADDAEAGDIVAELYEPFVRNNKPILRMSGRRRS